MTIVGIVSERLVIWPLRRPNPLLITLISIGLAICTRSLMMLVLGKKPVGYPGFSKAESFGFWGISFQTQTLWIFGITLVFLFGMHLFFERSMLGKALRAAAADREAAAIVGVKVETTVMLSFAIAAFAGAIAGAIITPLTLASYDQGAAFGSRVLAPQCWAASAACRERWWAVSHSGCWRHSAASTFRPTSRMRSLSRSCC